MSHDPIENLLRETDAADPFEPVDAGDLARGAREILERGRRRTAAAIVVGMIGLVAVTLTLGHRPRSRIVSIPSNRATAPRVAPHSFAIKESAETRALSEMRASGETRAMSATLAASAMLAVERRDAALQRLRRLRERTDADQWARDQNERSALVVLEGAASDTGGATRSYRRVIELFPDTAAAAVAREKLSNAR